MFCFLKLLCRKYNLREINNICVDLRGGGEVKNLILLNLNSE